MNSSSVIWYNTEILHLPSSQEMLMLRYMAQHLISKTLSCFQKCLSNTCTHTNELTKSLFFFNCVPTNYKENSIAHVFFTSFSMKLLTMLDRSSLLFPSFLINKHWFILPEGAHVPINTIMPPESLATPFFILYMMNLYICLIICSDDPEEMIRIRWYFVVAFVLV